MTNAMRQRIWGLFTFLSCLAYFGICPWSPVYAADLRNFEDAALRAVQFVDRNEGWAVGDAGVVLHTIDGGQTWERQSTGGRASLRSVHFLTPYIGWIVGREELGDGRSSGVMLTTTNGGLKWQRIGRNALPGLHVVRFLDDKVGFVAGEASDGFPTGLFATTDGGASWRPVPGPRGPGWYAADFVDAKQGILAGPWSRSAMLQDGKVIGNHDDSLGNRNLLGVHISGKNAFAVGQGGVVLRSDTAGARWSFADLKLAPEVQDAWDFHGLATVGTHLWAVGRPGTAILHSPDQGATFEVQHTGQPLPLFAACFIDDNNGWVVGEFGSVLHTADGGKKWTVQRRGGQRAALLFINARTANTPFETIARLGGEEGYLAAVLQPHAADPDSAPLRAAFDGDRLAAAVAWAGGAAGEMAWPFPVPNYLQNADKETLLKTWNRLHGDRAGEAYLRQLVLALRTWRPNVVVVDQSDAFTAEAVHEAYRLAANPREFPEQIKMLGLDAWKATRLFAACPPQNASIVFDGNDVSSRLESTYREHAAMAMNMLADRHQTLPERRGYRLLESSTPDSANGDFMAGIVLNAGGAARREQPALAASLASLKEAVQIRRNLQALAEQPANGLIKPDQLLAGMEPSLSKLPDEQGAAAACAMASQFARAGQWGLARQTNEMIIRRYPMYPQAAAAYRWLLCYSSSSEAKRRHELGNSKVVADMSFQSTPQNMDSPRAKINGHVTKTMESATTYQMQDDPEDRGLDMLAKQKMLPGTGTPPWSWNKGALEMAARLALLGPIYARDPAMHFCLNAARRNLGEYDAAQKWCKEFCDAQPPGTWREAAAAELWLAQRSGSPPKPVICCGQTASRPFLDGNLDDACWHDATPVILRDAACKDSGQGLGKEYATEARVAFDKEFLYVAVRCSHPRAEAVATVKGRKRDADVSDFDHVDILIDLDRDYATYYRLQIDQRGCVCDDCWGDKTWDPRWFVAVKDDQTAWQAEAAIPLTELTSESLTAGKAWACNIVRVVPGKGVAAMSLPADVEPRPEGMGLMLFLPTQTPGKVMQAN